LDTERTPWFKLILMDCDGYLTRPNGKPFQLIETNRYSFEIAAPIWKMLEQNGIRSSYKFKYSNSRRAIRLENWFIMDLISLWWLHIKSGVRIETIRFQPSMVTNINNTANFHMKNRLWTSAWIRRAQIIWMYPRNDWNYMLISMNSSIDYFCMNLLLFN
jgi:hypothetical protein